MNKMIKNIGISSFSFLAFIACNDSSNTLPANNYSRTKGFDWLVGMGLGKTNPKMEH
jgi:hypothetical protein